jgi:hypothetical protein
MRKTIDLISKDFAPTPIKGKRVKVVKFMTPNLNHSCSLTGNFKERLRREIATGPATPGFQKRF